MVDVVAVRPGAISELVFVLEAEDQSDVQDEPEKRRCCRKAFPRPGRSRPLASSQGPTTQASCARGWSWPWRSARGREGTARRRARDSRACSHWRPPPSGGPTATPPSARRPGRGRWTRIGFPAQCGADPRRAGLHGACGAFPSPLGPSDSHFAQRRSGNRPTQLRRPSPRERECAAWGAGGAQVRAHGTKNTLYRVLIDGRSPTPSWRAMTPRKLGAGFSS